MALTMERLESLVKGEGLTYFVDPTRPALMLGARGLNNRYQFLILLELGGEFLQFRTLGYHSCPMDHPNLVVTLKVLGELDYRLRFIKFGWDPNDGEIVAYGDAWLEDGDLTQGQFGRMIKSYLSVMDLQYARIDATIRTGEDPGEVNPLEALTRGKGSGLPDALREAIERLKGQREDSGEQGKDEEEEDIVF